ncbi:MAG: GNAT family N-acetyltransferase [Psychromonas sp.]
MQIGSTVVSHKNSNHRQLIQLKGSLSWCYQQCAQLIATTALPYFWLGDCPNKITSTLYTQILGLETSLLIINAYHHFDANQFAASEGTLRGGGTLLLICPNEVDHKDRFYTYIEKQLKQCSFLTLKQSDEKQSHQLAPISLTQASSHQPLNLEQQKLAVAAIVKTVTGHRRRPLVLTADRGRGKSAALGIATKQLVASGINNILVCAPSKAASATFFKHAGQSAQVSFIAPDLLLSTKPACALLIIDEAATLPIAMLEAITLHYPRLVFATTLQGYEGSGHGFALRFQKRLKEIAPQSRTLHLSQPIRWDKEDPLEHFTLRHLCLTESRNAKPSYNPQQKVLLHVISATQLVADPILLNELFSLLVIAHYQTKPSDLEKLLNDNHLSILVLKQNNQILSIALINHEGAIDAQLAEQIYQGERRLKGHLVAQSLTFHCANKQAATHKYARIQRIATHPEIQKQGLGKIFLTKITAWATENQFDHLCASFGATAQLLAFWQNKGFQTLRIGSRKDKSSGTHSFIVNLPLSEQGKSLHQLLVQQFQMQLPMQITRHLQFIDAMLILSLLKERPNKYYQHPVLTSYCSGNLPYAFAEVALIEVILTSDLSLLAKNQQKLTIQKILQNRSWADICRNNEYSGKKQAQQTLRTSIQELLTSTQ